MLGHGHAPDAARRPCRRPDRVQRGAPGDRHGPSDRQAEEDVGRRPDDRPRARRRELGQGHGRPVQPHRRGVAEGRRDVPGGRASSASARPARAPSTGTAIWVRDTADLVLTAAPGASPTPTPGGGIAVVDARAARRPATMSISHALSDHRPGRRHRRGRDDTGDAARLDRPADRRPGRARARSRSCCRPTSPRRRSDPGSARSAGSASPMTRRGSGPTRSPSRAADRRRAPLVLHGQPGLAHEWRLVSVSGRVDTRPQARRPVAGRARSSVGQKVVVVGEAGAGIPSADAREGPDRDGHGDRPAAVPERDRPAFRGDAQVRGRRPRRRAGPASGADRGPRRRPCAGHGSGRHGDPAPAESAPPVAPAADLVDLDGLVGATVRVGGLVVDLRPDGFTLDDGTATGRVILRGAGARPACR